MSKATARARNTVNDKVRSAASAAGAARDKGQAAGTPAASVGAKRRRMIWLAGIIAFMGWAGYTYVKQESLIADKTGQLAVKQESKQGAVNSLNQLKYEVSRLNDDEYIGQLARKRYNMYPEGERAIRKESSE
jgi:cell division protein DivIC